MLLNQIVSLLLDVLVGLFAGACLTRLYMQHQRIPFRNPVGATVFALSNWAVLPMRRVVPALGRWDLASLLAAMAAMMVKTSILFWLAGRSALSLAVLLGSAIGLIQLGISVLMALLVVNAVLSWVQANSAVGQTVWMLCDPLLRPLRRRLPSSGGLDWSSLVALLLLQVLSIVLNHLLAALA